MSVFICAKCGCVENTATSEYWSLVHNLFPIDYEDDLKGYEGKPLCSECCKLVFPESTGILKPIDEKEPLTKAVHGKWHNKFAKRLATEKEKLAAKDSEKYNIIDCNKL
jgi:hypothetical protein